MGAEKLRVALVCEDEAHRVLATGLADRVLLKQAELRCVDWIDEESLVFLRGYEGPADSDAGYYSMPRIKQIAEELDLSSQTVHKHRQSIRRKLQIDHREINMATYVRSQ